MTDIRLSGRTILVVEDAPLIALDIATALKTAGAEVTSVGSLDRAMDAADHRKWSAAVIDFGLGDNGVALCRRLQNDRVPFMFYSGQAGDALTEWPDAPFVSKPAATETIVVVLADLLMNSAPARRVETLRLFSH
jgi:DNA-binding response OmpR family regulator